MHYYQDYCLRGSWGVFWGKCIWGDIKGQEMELVWGNYFQWSNNNLGLSGKTPLEEFNWRYVAWGSKYISIFDFCLYQKYFSCADWTWWRDYQKSNFCQKYDKLANYGYQRINQADRFEMTWLAVGIWELGGHLALALALALHHRRWVGVGTAKCPSLHLCNWPSIIKMLFAHVIFFKAAFLVTY